MARLEKTAKAAAPAAPEVNVARAAVAPQGLTVAVPALEESAVTVHQDGSRTLVVHLPAFKKYTDQELQRAEADKGAEALAICDVTGLLIFNEKNANELSSTRPEYDGVVLSTAFLKLVVDKLKPQE